MVSFSQLSNREAVTKTADGQSSLNPEMPMVISPWVIVGAILGLSVVILIGVFVILHFMKTRRAAKKKNEQLPLFSDRRQLIRRKRNMTDQDRLEAQELERSLMIRKSLASRTTINTVASRDSQMIQSARTSRTSEYIDEYPADAAAQIQAVDWKEWEAQVQQERRYTRLRELATGGHAHPALSREMEDMAVPQQARVPSSGQYVKGSMHALPLSSLPSPPPGPPPPYRQTPGMPRPGNI